ncbi:hypothetical protein KBK19_06525 [Microvirga sp. STR05]|uniref:DUF2975 domain-containing protein n=1 Tax=Hymenobacter duratus TaxID=2771356 RepID=A0ABR8JCY8_9BACT|nr:hypothetical protein [Hymenobacter duratus]MBD2714682.1 hypothetical protein [Hymenobacter duratus]MBR7949586.1 hypothetical protein [Microvirga sp. STR05]
MKHDSWTLAKRHFWLSWWWGLLLLGAIFLFFLSFYYQPNRLLRFFEDLPTTFVILLLLAGVPALLGNLVRLRLMHRVFRVATSTAGLLLRTALVFEGVVAAFWGFWQLYRQSGLSIPFVFDVPIMQRIDGSLVLFFGLSLPWLVASVAAAWRLGLSQVGVARRAAVSG